MRNVSLLYIVVVCISFSLFSCGSEGSSVFDLSGEWTVKLDSVGVGLEEAWAASNLEGELISLPSTLDEAEIGTPIIREPAMNNYVLCGLTRKHQYIGAAWYRKEFVVPEAWEGRALELELERVLWESQVFIDGEFISSQESLSTPHRFVIAEGLTAGRHTITLRIDNSNKYPGINLSQSDRYPDPTNQDLAHAYTNQTQIKWNGVLGDMKLRIIGETSLSNVQVYPNVSKEEVKVVFDAEGDLHEMRYELISSEGNIATKGSIADGVKEFVVNASMLEKWDEFHPEVYTLKVFKGADLLSNVSFGYRELSNADGVLALNGQRIFLRGNLECVIFPLTGRPPLEKEEWLSLIRSAKDYGLNHLRFHSWCPPKAAFEAADESGFYLQVELPHWNLNFGADEEAEAYLQREGDRIIQEYGNHPSFMFMALGNELEGDIELMNSTVARLKAKDSRHLYTTTTYSFQYPLGTIAQPEDDFFVTQKTDKGWVRGQGIFNAFPPNFSEDYTASSVHVKVPLISHEIGQYSVYPDMSEIDKYTGVLTPLNFMAVKNELEKKGLLDLARDFTYASGRLAAMLYKEEIERALKTPAFDGFQLLQLQDFPGQGTALVGLLNAFWESKGVISAEEFRQFNSEVVPLLRFEKAVYEQGEIFKAGIEVANFFEEMKDKKLVWKVICGDEVLHEGVIDGVDLNIGNNVALGSIVFDVEAEEAKRLEIVLSILETAYHNSWPVWVYPQTVESAFDEVLFCSDWKLAEKGLLEGKKVLFNPDYKSLAGIAGRFGPVFWSPVHFPNNPTSMGLLLDSEHAAFDHFPTKGYTEWQWWDLCVHSKSVNFNELEVEPLVRVIDNFVINNNLSNVFEAQVGDGELVFCSIDLTTDLDKRPVARQLRYSLLKYMESEGFNPEEQIDFGALKKLKK